MPFPAAEFIEAAIVQALCAESTIADLVGNHIAFGRSPSGSMEKDRIVIRRSGGNRFLALNGPTGLANPRFQINCFASDYTKAKRIAKAVREYLDGYSTANGGDMAGFDVGSVEVQEEADIEPSSGGGDLEQTNQFGVALDVVFMHQESVNPQRVTAET